MDELNKKEVYFGEFCKNCEYVDNLEDEEPCDRCLSIPARLYSHKPEYFKEVKNNGKQKTE